MRGSTIRRAAERAVPSYRIDERQSWQRRMRLEDQRLFSLLLTLSLVMFLAPSSSAMPAPGDAGPADPAVSESTGSANFKIPIQVPPGPGGLAPNLALSYSSRRGDGPYGVGWDLDLGEIACSARFGVPDYANCGRFELNGQLLTKDGATNSYHSFVETFQQIEYRPASKTWQVINPNGTILRYGVDSDARIMSGSDIARWFLSEIQDPFGNSVFITYDSADPGTRVPLRITYGAGATKAFGKRQIEFLFDENRPDPLHDFVGGIERELTKRLSEIKVSSYGSLVRRYAFGYSLPGVSYTTSRSRLSWVQQFGSDCTGAISECTGLPRQEYEYTDPSDSGTTERFAKFDVNENYVIPFSGNGHLGVPPVRMGDVNGDGLPDLIKGGFYIGGFAEATVEINTGTGFALDAAWTAALRNLPLERPRADFTQIRAVPADWVLGDNVGIFDATFSTTTAPVGNPLSETLMANPSRPFANSSFGAKDLTATGEAVPGWIEAVGRMHFTDVDGDGFADIIVSIRLSGVNKVLDSLGNAITPVRIPGKTISRVYRNTGTGWQAEADPDADLGRGLPPFGVVIFESTYGVEIADPWGDEEFWLTEVDGKGDSSCGSRGLRGWSRSSGGVEYGDDVCIDLVNLDPIFTDFNGDGFPDLMVLELDHPESLYRGAELYRGPNPFPFPPNFGKSRAWVQVPNAAEGEPRWVRATQYDLPSVDFGAGPWAASSITPFAHSGLGRTTGIYVGVSESSTATCRRFDQLTFETCAPTSYNKDNGVRLVDLNRDGLTDVIWSLYDDTFVGAVVPPLTQGVLLNTGSGWCASTAAMAAHVGSQCAHAAMFYPPTGSIFDPNLPVGPNGFAFRIEQPPPGIPTGYLADFNSDGWMDFLQLQLPTAAFAASAAWLYNPAGASLDPPNVWVRDARYDINVAFGALAAPSILDGVSFAFLDVNGDGAADVVGDVLRGGDLNGPGPVFESPQAFISNSKHSDLLKLVRNGRGGEIAIAYESAIVQRDASLGGLEDEAEADVVAVGETLNETTIADVIRWTSAPVVSEVKIAGPNRKPGPGESTFGPPTTYRYAHPRFCVKNRSDLGFRVVEKTRPGGEVVTSKFYQVHGRAGKTSSVVVSGNNGVGHVYREYWETQEQSALLPQPAGRPLVPAVQPGSIDDPEVHVGRLAQVRSYNLYGAGPVPAGGQTVRTLHFDDSYGYNFANKIVEKRPTSVLTTLRVPGSDVPNAIFGLSVEQKLFDWEMAGFAIASQDFIKHTLMGYQLGRPSSLTEMVKGQDDTGPGTAESHSMTYDSYGNLSQEIVHGSLPSDDRLTRFCYDGDRLAGMAWCPDFGQSSHSVRVGVMDSTGDGINAAVGVTSFEPDAGTGAIVGTRSTYTDEPSLSVSLDPFGRPVESFVSGDDQLWMRTSKAVYIDVPFEPAVVARFDYPADGAADADAIWSSIVSDGFGGTWKEIGKTPTGYVGTFTYHDPFLRSVRKSLPVACPDASCAAQTGASEPLAMRMTLDAIGRAVRDDTPHGFSILEYSATTKTGGPGTIGGAFDSVLEKNGKGDVIQRAMDGDRVAWVDECEDSVAAGATTIGSCSGPATTHTYYDYESTGEVRTIYDARAAASSFSDPNHTLQYHYDTLGRVVQIDDPALAGAGYTRTTYDVFGNVETVTNARGKPRIHTYDRLNRLTKIDTPAGETDYTVSYRSDEKQSWTDFSNDYSRTMTYDDLGRVQQEQMAVRNAAGSLINFYTDYTYDLVGRVTEVVHPAKHYDPETAGWQNTIVRYEYDGAFLDKVCDLGSAASCATAETQYVSSVGFDSLGRRTSIDFPGGTRTFSYNAEHRLSSDNFDSPAYQYTRNYTAYDGIGNILAITGNETATQALDMNETYVYDQRNRIQQWIKEGTAHAFDYDDLGNLILHADEAQTYDDPERPHAIKSRTTPASTISYSYDDDGNVKSILGGTSPQYFRFDSANQIVCLGATSAGCDTRVAYDVSGKRIAEYPAGGQAYKAYIGDAFLFEHVLVVDLASVEIMLDGERVALKRFRPQLRGASAAGLFVFSIPPPWIAGGTGFLALLLMLWGLQNGTLVLVQLRPLRAATALTAASSLLLPYIAMAGVPTGANPPSYYWEISDPLGTGMVMFDINGERVRHQVFTPFGRIHDEVGADFRTFYAGHRRDDGSGLFYMQARWYDPGSGRFLSVDPLIRTILVPQSANAYSYAENNPTNGVDPSGMNVLGWAGPSGRPALFADQLESGYANENGERTNKNGNTQANLLDQALDNFTDISIDIGLDGGKTGSQSGTTPQDGGIPFDASGVETLAPVIGEGPASHNPAQLNSLFSGVAQFPTVTPNSFANFMNGMMSGGLAMSASPASLPARASPPPPTQAQRIVSILSWLPGPGNAGFHTYAAGYGWLGISAILLVGAGVAFAGVPVLIGIVGGQFAISGGALLVSGVGAAGLGFTNLYIGRKFAAGPGGGSPP